MRILTLSLMVLTSAALAVARGAQDEHATFTVGSANEADSMIPLLEFPINTSTCFSRLQ